jgi:hypothetical protein
VAESIITPHSEGYEIPVFLRVAMVFYLRTMPLVARGVDLDEHDLNKVAGENTTFKPPSL